MTALGGAKMAPRGFLSSIDCVFQQSHADPDPRCDISAVGRSLELTAHETTRLIGREAVAASELLLSSIFDSAPVGITVVGFDGHWLRVNRECCRMLGYEPKDLIGASIADITHPDDVAEDHRRLTAMVAGELDTQALEKRYLHRNGSVVWVHVRAELIRTEADEPLYVVAHIQDITERRVAQAQRRESDRRLHAIIDNSPLIVTVKGKDHRYQLVNREFQEWCGLPDDHIVGRNADEMASGPLFAGERVKDQLVLDGHGPVQDEDTLWRDDAERVFLTTRFPLLDDSGQVNAVCCTSTDITERRDEERAKRERLQSSAQIYEALAQDRFVLQGQPIMNLASRQVEQAELLIRVRRTTDGGDLVAPGEFLPAAERFGFIGVVDQ
jgi:PAS domain S-box-containing protein